MSLPIADPNAVMASVAARLLGRKPAVATTATASPPCTASSSARNVQPPPVASSESKGPAHASTKGKVTRGNFPKENVSPHAAPPSSSKAPTAQPVPKENVKMSGLNDGPSLIGTADQLAAAREFAQSATTGRAKSRGSSRSSGRERLFSKEPERVSTSSSSSSTRSSAKTITPSIGNQLRSATESTTQASTSHAEVKSGTAGPGTLLARPPVKLTAAVAPTTAPTPTTSPAQAKASGLADRWNAFTTKPPTNKTEDRKVDELAMSVQKLAMSVQKLGLSHAHPSNATPTKNDETKTRSGFPLTDVTNTLIKNATQSRVPPHLRCKGDAAGTPEKKGNAASGIAASSIVTDDAGSKKAGGGEGATKGVPGQKVDTTSKSTGDPMVVDTIDWKKAEPATNGTQDHVVTTNGVEEAATPKKNESKPAVQEQDFKPTSEFPQTKSQPSQDTPDQAKLQAAIEDVKKSTADGEDDAVVRALKMMKEEVAAMGARVGRMEQDNFEMHKQVEKLTQSEERRKFLGTNSAKVPFGLDVKCPEDKTHTVQVDAKLKVYELIRRVRAAADLAPTVTANPRIIVDGKVVGHGMMLGEVGISKDKLVEVEFKCDA